MRNITVVDTLSLSIPERIQLVEEIWDTIADQTEAVELTEAEKRIIDERLEAYHRDPDAGSSWEDVYQRIISGKSV
jgi:putative addiction module component (TIGR02574 family)